MSGGGRHEVSGVSTRQHLLNAGLRLLAEKGYQGAIAREIARAAGVTEVTLYRHFRSKDELFSIAITEEAERVTAFLPEPSGHLEEDLRALARHIDAHVSAERDRMARVLLELQRHPEVLKQAVVKSVRGFFDKISALFRYYRETGELTSDLGEEAMAVFLGPMHTNLLLGDLGGESVTFDHEQYVRHFLDGYRGAARNPPKRRGRERKVSGRRRQSQELGAATPQP